MIKPHLLLHTGLELGFCYSKPTSRLDPHCPCSLGTRAWNTKTANPILRGPDHVGLSMGKAALCPPHSLGDSEGAVTTAHPQGPLSALEFGRELGWRVSPNVIKCKD